MPRNDPIDLQPPMKYKTWRAARPLTAGEIRAAADRAEARAMRIQLNNNSSNLAQPARDRLARRAKIEG